MRDIAWEQNYLDIPLKQEFVSAIDLHVLRDTSVVTNGVILYAVAYQPTLINQGLVTITSRICKHNVTIPRVELISTHTRANSIENVNLALQNQNTRSVTGRTNNTVDVH